MSLSSSIRVKIYLKSYHVVACIEEKLIKIFGKNFNYLLTTVVRYLFLNYHIIRKLFHDKSLIYEYLSNVKKSNFKC